MLSSPVVQNTPCSANSWCRCFSTLQLGTVASSWTHSGGVRSLHGSRLLSLPELKPHTSDKHSCRMLL